MKAIFGKYGSALLSAAFLLLITADPKAAATAVKDGFVLCTELILPSLLPFFFAAGIINFLGIPELMAKVFGKTLKRLFGLSPYAATPLIIGFLGGYPIGAATLAELCRDGYITPEEAEKLLPICNNTGPAFIIGAVGAGIFGSVRLGVLLYGVHILAALSLAFLFRTKNSSPPPEVLPIHVEEHNPASALVNSVRSAVEKSLNICAFVLFFCVLAAVLEELGLVSSAALLLNRMTSLEIGFCRSLISGIMELGGGIASMSTLQPTALNYALASFILGFGSLSVHCQTLSVVSDAKIKCARHFTGRILHGLISALFTFMLSGILRI